MPEAVLSPSLLTGEPPDPVADADRRQVQRAAGMVGGDDALDALLAWASNTLSPSERETLNQRLQDPNTSDAALEQLTARYASSAPARPYATAAEFQAGSRAAANSDTAAELHMRRASLTPVETLSIQQ